MKDTYYLNGRPLPCRKCGGEGRKYQSRYGGNDPDVWDSGQCDLCDGSGTQICEDCGKHPAVAKWKSQGKGYLVCLSCHEEWLEEDAP